jgi:hypothetical protein
MDRDDIMNEDLAREAAEDAVALELERRVVEDAAEHLDAMYDVYDEYMDHEPDVYAGTYSEM